MKGSDGRWFIYQNPEVDVECNLGDAMVLFIERPLSKSGMSFVPGSASSPVGTRPESSERLQVVEAIRHY